MRPNLYIWMIGGLACCFLSGYHAPLKPTTLHPIEEQSVAQVLEALGEPPLPHKANLKISGASIDVGRTIVTQGISTKGQKIQSKHFVCTSCHTLQKDMPDLAKADPQTKLDYAFANNIPFLPGSALYGIVNRTSFYNGDYEKKYGDLVFKARNNLREAIQLCATECAQGRKLEPFELESVLAYLETIDLKMSDLLLNPAESALVSKALQDPKKESSQVASMITSKYLKGMPATFVTPPTDRAVGYGMKGKAENGQKVFQLACLYCHKNQRYSFFNLEDNKIDRQFLGNHMRTYDRFSVYQVARYGTSPVPGKKAYMPHYTAEKMNDQQLEDLRAYLTAK